MSITDLKQFHFCSLLLKKEKQNKTKQMIVKQMEYPITDYKDMLKPLLKPLCNISRKEMIHNLRKFRDA